MKNFKVAFIGAGSLLFTRRLVADLLAVPEFNALEIALMDINEHNQELVYELVKRDIESNGLHNVKLTATTDRKEALKNARYVFNVIRVGGIEAFESDIEIPLKYKVDQCVGDTLCAGGIMYGQRGIPAVLDICRDIKEVSEPDCLLLSYSNPNAMITWACNKYGGVNTIGLCHGVQHSHAQISEALGVPKEELDYSCVGINHQTWFVKLAYKGQDMRGKLLDALKKHPVYSEQEKVRIDMLERFGYYSTESNGHLSEYLPWYRKRTDEINDWIELSDWIHGETGGYLRVCTEKRNYFTEKFPEWIKEPPFEYLAENRSGEHGSYILEGLETGRVYRGHFNVVNRGIVTNLPYDAIVEVPGYMDRNGINIPVFGDLPLGCAAVCDVSINVQRLSVEAAVKGDDLLLRQAMMMDSLVGAVCNPPEIWQMVDEMLVAQEKWLPQYKKAIKKAKKRLTEGLSIQTFEDYKGAARLRTRIPFEIENGDAARVLNTELSVVSAAS